MKTPFECLRQAVSELSRDELEVYAITNAVGIQQLGAMVGDNCVGFSIARPPGCDQSLSRRMTAVALKVNQRIDEIHTDATKEQQERN